MTDSPVLFALSFAGLLQPQIRSLRSIGGQLERSMGRLVTSLETFAGSADRLVDRLNSSIRQVAPPPAGSPGASADGAGSPSRPNAIIPQAPTAAARDPEPSGVLATIGGLAKAFVRLPKTIAESGQLWNAISGSVDAFLGRLEADKILPLDGLADYFNRLGKSLTEWINPALTSLSGWVEGAFSRLSGYLLNVGPYVLQQWLVSADLYIRAAITQWVGELSQVVSRLTLETWYTVTEGARSLYGYAVAMCQYADAFYKTLEQRLEFTFDRIVRSAVEMILYADRAITAVGAEFFSYVVDKILEKVSPLLNKIPGISIPVPRAGDLGERLGEAAQSAGIQSKQITERLLGPTPPPPPPSRSLPGPLGPRLEASRELALKRADEEASAFSGRILSGLKPLFQDNLKHPTKPELKIPEPKFPTWEGVPFDATSTGKSEWSRPLGFPAPGLGVDLHLVGVSGLLGSSSPGFGLQPVGDPKSPVPGTSEPAVGIREDRRTEAGPVPATSKDPSSVIFQGGIHVTVHVASLAPEDASRSASELAESMLREIRRRVALEEFRRGLPSGPID